MKKIAIVTGSNKGIGFETVYQLAKLQYKVVLTARDPKKGEEALLKLKQENLDVIFRPLDVSSEDSILSFTDFVKKNLNPFDALINNAGIFLDQYDPTHGSIFNVKKETLQNTLETNLYGPLLLIKNLRPFMSDEARIVNVSSGMGQLSEMAGGSPCYRISKTALNAVTKIVAAELNDTTIKVNSVCPGWVQTDMGGPNAPRSIEKGAETIVWCATLPKSGPSGGFFRDKKEISW